jgi:hypothetical protein
MRRACGRHVFLYDLSHISLRSFFLCDAACMWQACLSLRSFLSFSTVFLSLRCGVHVAGLCLYAAAALRACVAHPLAWLSLALLRTHHACVALQPRVLLAVHPHSFLRMVDTITGITSRVSASAW